MSNKSILTENNNILSQALSLIQNLDLSKSGIYTWRRFAWIPDNIVEHPQFTADFRAGNQYITVTGSNFDMKYIEANKNLLDGFVDGNKVFRLTETGGLRWSIDGTYTTVKGYSDEYKQISIQSAISQVENYLNMNYVYPGSIKFEDAKKGGFICYVVSDDVNEYPDKALHTDGYYYEKYNLLEAFNCSKVAFDTFSLDYDLQANAYTVQHSLGEKPKYMFISTEDVGSVSSATVVSMMLMAYGSSNVAFAETYKNYDGMSGYSSTAGGSAYMTETSTILPMAQYLKGGVEYTVISMA